MIRFYIHNIEEKAQSSNACTAFLENRYIISALKHGHPLKVVESLFPWLTTWRWQREIKYFIHLYWNLSHRGTVNITWRENYLTDARCKKQIIDEVRASSMARFNYPSVSHVLFFNKIQSGNFITGRNITKLNPITDQYATSAQWLCICVQCSMLSLSLIKVFTILLNQSYFNVFAYATLSLLSGDRCHPIRFEINQISMFWTTHLILGQQPF